ncbi:MAG: T9SS type A sorting domain-containing protein [Bacteroides sp.]|nr:T9SS type A sorting domain-containing protein [Bacteroides sp.]
MKQLSCLSITALLLGATALLPALPANGAMTSNTNPFEKGAASIQYGPQTKLKKAERPTRADEYPDDIDFKIKVDCNSSKLHLNCILCYNEIWGFVLDEVDVESDGYFHVSDIPGEYLFVAVFDHTDHDGSTIVVKEKVDIQEGCEPVMLDAYTATEKITFDAVTSDGSPFKGDILANDEVSVPGAIYTGYGNTEIYHQTLGQLLTCFFHLEAVDKDGVLTYGPQEGDIYINSLGNDSEIAVVQVRLGRTERGFEIVKMQAQGTASQTVTNDADSYLNLKNVFSPHNTPNSWVEAGYAASESMGYVSVWQGNIEENQVLSAVYFEEQPNMDMMYVSAPPTNDPACDFQIIPLFGTHEESGDNDFIGRGSGLFLPFMLDNGDGRFKVLDNAAANGFSRDEWTHSQEYIYPNIDAFNPYLEYYIPSGSEEIWGNSVPIVLASIGYRHNTDSRLQFAFIGRKGDNRYIDNQNCKFKMTADGEVISERVYYTSKDFEYWRMEGGDFRSTRAEYVITIEDENVIVDGIQGYNKTKIYYDTNMSSANPPALRSLQFRDGEGNLCDRFNSFDDAVLEFYAGDFEMGQCDYGYNYFFNYGMLNDAIAEYAPHGTDEWHSLYPEDVPELFTEVAYGALYRAPLSDVTAESEDGWYDLRIKLYDTNDNYQIQELSPAFKLNKPDGVTKPSVAVNMAGREVEVLNMQGINVYSGIYDNIGNMALEPGVYIVRTLGGSNSATKKLTIN